MRRGVDEFGGLKPGVARGHERHPGAAGRAQPVADRAVPAYANRFWRGELRPGSAGRENRSPAGSVVIKREMARRGEWQCQAAREDHEGDEGPETPMKATDHCLSLYRPLSDASSSS